MNKNLLAFCFSVLLFSALVGTSFLSPATAQWNIPPLPSNPDSNPPSIEILSPVQNQLYNSSDVWLNFTVTKPETWLGDVGRAYGWTGEGYSGLAYIYWGKITFVRYSLDGVGSENFPANDPTWYNTVLKSPSYKTLDFSYKLPRLSNGSHTLIVSAESESVYGNWSHNTVVGSTKMDFYVNVASPRITIWIVVATVIIATVGVAFLVYFRKIRKKLPST